MCVGGIRRSTIATSGACSPTLAIELLGVARLADDVEARLAEQQRDALAQEHRVVGQHYAHGISALSRVPPAGGLQTFRRPSSASTRSASPRSPEPFAGSAPPLPSSVISTISVPLSRLTSTVADSRLGVLGDVGQALGDEVVGGDLDLRRRALGEVDVERDADRRAGGERLQRHRQAVVAQDRGVDAARDLAQLLQRGVELARGQVSAARPPCCRRARLPAIRRRTTRERDEPLLRAVVEVALELAAGGVAGFDDPGARGAQVAQAGAQVGLQALVLERDPGGGGDGADQLAARPASEASWISAATGVPSRSTNVATRPASAGSCERLAVGADVGLVLGHPVGELERRVAQRAGERVPQRAGLGRLAQVDEQRADRASGRAGRAAGRRGR